MNFLDGYDISGPSTPKEGPEPTLNEEVTQVVGQLSRFWGGFRKQSHTMLETARKDFTQVVSQAQRELTKLTAESVVETPSGSTTETTEDTPAADASTSTDPSSGGSSLNDVSSATLTSDARPTDPVSVSMTASNLFSRLQSSLPANLASTVQAQLPESIRQGGSIDFAQWRSTLSTELQRVQGVTRAQAEEYVHKSEELLREAGEFLKDAVKVIPPDEDQADVGVLWDGTDVWMLPDMSSGGSSKGKGKERQSIDGRSSSETRAGATRADALLKQLRHDPEVIRVDPEVDDKVRELWTEWISKEVDSEEHGIVSEKWTAAVQAALGDPEDGDALQRTMDVLVPSAIPSEIFWTRYFFRVHQVEVEEERRKALIEGTAENEEDINWESDDDEAADPTTDTAASLGDPVEHAEADPTARLATSRETLIARKASVTSTPATTSPRLSSEGSYDVVSEQVSNAGDSRAGEGEGHKKDNTGNDDEVDSDWE